MTTITTPASTIAPASADESLKALLWAYTAHDDLRRSQAPLGDRARSAAFLHTAGMLAYRDRRAA